MTDNPYTWKIAESNSREADAIIDEALAEYSASLNAVIRHVHPDDLPVFVPVLELTAASLRGQMTPDCCRAADELKDHIAAVITR